MAALRHRWWVWRHRKAIRRRLGLDALIEREIELDLSDLRDNQPA